jgi:hypothetical protein
VIHGTGQLLDGPLDVPLDHVKLVIGMNAFRRAAHLHGNAKGLQLQRCLELLELS